MTLEESELTFEKIEELYCKNCTKKCMTYHPGAPGFLGYATTCKWRFARLLIAVGNLGYPGNKERLARGECVVI